MLQRDPIVDDLIGILCDWSDALNLRGLRGCFLFGSAVNEDGLRFESDKSDLDIVVCLDWEPLGIAERLDQLELLRQRKSELEVDLFRTLGRRDGGVQIASVVPITSFEIEHAIHKDGADRILISTPAYDLTSRKVLPGLNGGQAKTRLATEHRHSLQFVQKKRAEALSLTPNGRGGLSVAPHDDPVPKELMRHFAVVTADLETTREIASLDRGLEEITRFAENAVGWLPSASSLKAWLGVKRGSRGRVDPTIRADHYLLLVEAIYDALRRQYPAASTAKYAPPANKPDPDAKSLSPSHRLASRFTVTLANQIGGRREELRRAILAARANMRARVIPAFELVFEEAPDAEALLAAQDADLDSAAYKRKMKAFERRTFIAACQSRCQEGIELILWYGGTLFKGTDNEMERGCSLAIKNWIAVAATNVVNPGGGLEAWHDQLYPAHGMALSFSAPLPELGSITPLASLGPDLLARSFVPNLVAKYLYRSEIDASLVDQRDSIFDVTNWCYGLK